jgi:UDP-glucose:(heptosyl)LPS alpha-1,3-glucosyltransferase
MDIALCYEHVVPARGGAEHYVADLAHSLVADNHRVHLYASSWDADALPRTIHFHRLPSTFGPRFARPWQFGHSCLTALSTGNHDVSIGFNKTWGQDVLYPQGGLHVASAEHNLHKHRTSLKRRLARLVQQLDWAQRSYRLLERRQYLGPHHPLIIANSRVVRTHFQAYYGIPASDIRVVYSAIDASRLAEDDRLERRQEWRRHWGIAHNETVAVFSAMNYQLKGLEPLLLAVRLLPLDLPFRLLVAGNPRIGHYQRLARRLGVERRVVFAGYCPEMRNCYFAGDFLVHPTFYDPCSLVVLEAMACGLPVITSQINGASELLSPPDDGYIIEDPHDSSRLAWCIMQLTDPARRTACGDVARQKARRWTFQEHYRQLLQVLTEAADKRQRCAAA